MKKLIFGCVLFLSGFTWLTILMVLSIDNPWSYNGIDGFTGFLLGTDTVGFFVTAVILTLLGIVIMIHNAGFTEGIQLPDWMKSE